VQKFQSIVSPHGDCARKPNGDSPRGGIRQLRHRIGSLPGSRYQRDGNHICHNPHKPCKRSNRLFRQTGTVPASPTGTVPAAGSDSCWTGLVPYRAAATSVTAIIFVTTPTSHATIPINCFAARGLCPQAQRGQSPRRDQTAAGPDWFLTGQPLPA